MGGAHIQSLGSGSSLKQWLKRRYCWGQILLSPVLTHSKLTWVNGMFPSVKKSVASPVTSSWNLYFCIHFRFRISGIDIDLYHHHLLILRPTDLLVLPIPSKFDLCERIPSPSPNTKKLIDKHSKRFELCPQIHLSISYQNPRDSLNPSADFSPKVWNGFLITMNVKFSANLQLTFALKFKQATHAVVKLNSCKVQKKARKSPFVHTAALLHVFICIFQGWQFHCIMINLTGKNICLAGESQNEPVHSTVFTGCIWNRTIQAKQLER